MLKLGYDGVCHILWRLRHYIPVLSVECRAGGRTFEGLILKYMLSALRAFSKIERGASLRGETGLK
jgi:hypothetical protein